MNKSEEIPGNSSDTVDLVALWNVLWWGKYIVISTVVVCTLVAVILALTATPMFRAEVVISEVQDKGLGGGAAGLVSQLGGLASLAGVNLSGGAAGHDAQAVLKSRRLIEEFITRNQLVPQLLPNAKQQATTWFAINRFQKNVLSINEDSRKGVTTITIDWTDPVTVERWANGFVALANELMRSRALEDANRNIAYLNQQLGRTDVVELRRVIYNLVESETKTLMLANARTEYAFKVIDPATVPEQRISPRRTLMVAVGIAIGSMLGVLIALLSSWIRGKRQAVRYNA